MEANISITSNPIMLSDGAREMRRHVKGFVTSGAGLQN